MLKSIQYCILFLVRGQTEIYPAGRLHAAVFIASGVFRHNRKLAAATTAQVGGGARGSTNRNRATNVGPPEP